jgi:DNA-binding transcriptional MerR regulator
MENIEIPNKSLFKMNEVCSLTGVKSYVLRFWESEFDEISPIISSSGKKLYGPKDVEAIMTIKKLLFEDKYTIEKARASMNEMFSNSSNESIDTDVVDEFDGIDDVEVSVSPQVTSSQAALSDSGLQKIVLAKAKLTSLISLTKSIQKAHNWA